MVTPPATDSVPGELPGASVPSTFTEPRTRPMPRRAPGWSTCTWLVSSPLARSMPSCTQVPLESVAVPVMLSVPLPLLMKQPALPSVRIWPLSSAVLAASTLTPELPLTSTVCPVPRVSTVCSVPPCSRITPVPREEPLSIRITPPSIRVPPVKVLLPLTTSVPPPRLTSPPVPLMSPWAAKVTPASVVIEALPALISRSRSLDIDCVTVRSPPLKVIGSEARPRFASRLTCSEPPLSVVPPV